MMIPPRAFYAAVSPAVATIVAETACCVQFERLDASGFELDISADDCARRAASPIRIPQPLIVVVTTLFGQLYKSKATIAVRARFKPPNRLAPALTAPKTQAKQKGVAFG
jgi:hypothetical protein